MNRTMRHTLGLVSMVGLLASAACSSQTTPVQPTVLADVGPITTASHGGGGGGTPPPPPPNSNPLVISTSPLQNGNIGTFYAAFVTSSGGQGTPHTFSLVAGSLPPGLTMAKSYGVQSTSITGKPTTLGTWTFTVRVRDQAGHTASAPFSITIDPARPLVITNQSDTLAPGTIGSAYATNLFADGGVPPYEWAIIAGQLPPGIRLSSNQLNGTPTTGGIFTFTARVTDSAGATASRTFSITVN